MSFMDFATGLEWFKSYLTRYQIIKIIDTLSTSLSVSARIAQGTVLGLLIFIFYRNIIVSDLKNVNISMFTDGCGLYMARNN